MLEPLSSRERFSGNRLRLPSPHRNILRAVLTHALRKYWASDVSLCIPFAEGKKVSNPGTDFGSLLRVKKEKDTSFHKK